VPLNCQFREIGAAGAFGVREGIAADAAMNYYGGCAQARELADFYFFKNAGVFATQKKARGTRAFWEAIENPSGFPKGTIPLPQDCSIDRRNRMRNVCTS